MNPRMQFSDDKVIKQFVVKNKKGLHTRPSTEIVRCATGFKSDVTLKYQDMSVNAKSLLGILMLAASKGAKIKIEAIGEDAQQAVDSIIALAERGFDLDY